MKPQERPRPINEAQRRILIVCAVLALIAVLFPPWNRSGGRRFAGYFFIISTDCRTCELNSSYLFLEIAGLALATWVLFIAARDVRSRLPEQLILIFGCIIVAGLVTLYAWTNRYSYAQDNSAGYSLRTNRFTGARDVWSDQKGWIAENEFRGNQAAETERKRVVNEQIANDLKEIRVDSWHDHDYFEIYNPTHMVLPYSETQLTVEFYSEGKLLKIATQKLQIEPGINKIWIMEARELVDRMPVKEKISIHATAAHRIGESMDFELIPQYELGAERNCKELAIPDEDQEFIFNRIVCKP